MTSTHLDLPIGLTELVTSLLAEGLAALSFVTVATDAEGGQTVNGNDPDKIRVVVDAEPFAALSLLGLHRIEVEE